jgi:hypothetical protein
LIADPQFAGKVKSLAERMKSYQLETNDPRATGDMELFRKTREYVLNRKRNGYEQTLELPFK